MKRIPNLPEELPRLDSLTTSHTKTILLQFFLSSMFFCIIFFGLLAMDQALWSVNQYWAFFCVIYVMVWWIVYFRSPQIGIWTLRRFLDTRSRFRDLNVLPCDSIGVTLTAQGAIKQSLDEVKDAAQADEWDDMKDKSQSTVSTLNILVAVVTLFLTLVIQGTSQTSYYEVILYKLTFSTAIVTILCMVFAIDILDTVSNLWRSDIYEDDRKEDGIRFSRYFYHGIGPGPPSGGLSYGYYGYACFASFIVMSVAMFDPLFAGIGTATYAYLGYPFWFGYRGKKYCKDVQQVDGSVSCVIKYRVDFDRSDRLVLVTRGLGLFFLAVTIVVNFFST